MPHPRPTIAVGALGGTIASRSDAPGGAVSPTLDAASLVAAVPELADVADVDAATLATLPSPSVGLAQVRAALDFAERTVAAGAKGVVLTHGTDTLEETAWLLDLCWPHPEPIVVTGAMRHLEALSPDGAANVLAACRVAADDDTRGLGVVACLDETIHAARFVQKTDSTALSTFRSPGWGPLGRVIEGRVRLAMRPARRHPALPMPSRDEVRVPVVEALLADDGWHLATVLAARPAGLVISGAGAGHVSAEAAPAVERALATGLPVVLASRTGAGSTLVNTYGYVGSEAHLLGLGAIGAGFLHARKARLLLQVLLDAGADLPTIRHEFDRRGS